ncbi:two-component system sensor histidine kinase NtrB [Pelovirga terrestris]|uniref:histidine kinase n=1 Tax=Pelovirga terrestris TaxID=2771352 RepID=A0A8J6QR22_9BACT|nr:PAS domain-containing sensor histidine kinase [Pelovirga terrestris]MBD1400553.1 PAS domain-containing sensor histidine kinase [Pelovirga terrestris]
MDGRAAGAVNQQSRSPWGFAQLLEQIDMGILVLDLGRQQVDYCNAALFEVLGDDLLCQSYERLYALFVTPAEQSDLPARSSHQVLYQERLYGYTVYRADPRYCCLFVRDITEKQRLESIAQAINAMDNLGFVFSGIRHEIGNPLNSLKMALMALQKSTGNENRETLDEYIERALADVGRMEYLLKSLKAFSLYDRVELREMSLIEFMEKFIALVEPDFHAGGIRIRTAIPLDIRNVRIDERALHQALLNIFNNAAEALKGCRDPEIHITTQKRGELVWLKIRDNGCGIKPEQRNHLFQPFNTSKPQGNGLGLVITRKLLAMMNGDIAIESWPQRGTEVRVSLPLAEAAQKEPVAADSFPSITN